MKDLDEITNNWTPEDLNLLFIATSIIWGVDIKNTNRTINLVYARATFFKIAREEIIPKKTLSEIGKYLKKDHATVIYATGEKFKEYLKEKGFAEKFILVRDKFEELKSKKIDGYFAINKIDIATLIENQQVQKMKDYFENQIKYLRLYNQQLKEENEKYKALRLESFLIDISSLPEEQRNEFRDVRWIPYKRMLESRVNYKN